MTLTLKPRAGKEQRAKRNLAPLAMQEQLHAKSEEQRQAAWDAIPTRGNGKPSSEMREAMRKGLIRKAAEMVYEKFPLNVKDLINDPRTITSVAITAGLCWEGANVEDRESGFRFVGTGMGFDVSNPAGSLGTITYEELLRELPLVVNKSPDTTGTTTPAGIVANDPDASPPKSNGKQKKGPPAGALEAFAARGMAATAAVEKILSPESAEALAALPVKKVTTSQFERHPDNRHPAEAEVAALAEDMKARQQREPILARLLKSSSLQILWGEKRWLAAKKAGIPSLYTRIIECDDKRALELVAQGNAQRSDFNPIQKAVLIEKLCKAGKTREAAAADVGLESGSAASNLVRLLKLPKLWQERVATGELAESWARLLTPYVHLGGIMKELDEDWKKRDGGGYRRNRFETRDELDERIDDLLHEELRVLTEKRYFSNYREGIRGGDYACLIELTPETRKKLGVTTVELSDEQGKTKTVEAATNVKLYDQLQTAAIKAKLAARASKKAKGAGAKADAGEREKPKTKAELEYARKIRAEQLGRSIDDWKERIVRREIAAAIRKAKPGDLKVQKLVVSCLFDPPPEPHYNEPSFRDMLEGLLGLAKGKARSAGEYQAISEFASSGNLLYALAAEFVAAAIGGTADRPSHYLWQETLDALFVEWGCDMTAAWQKLVKTPELEEFFQMHRKGELQVLGKELGVHLADNLGKPQMLKLLLNRTSPLPLPKVLQPAQPKRKKGAK